MIAARLNTLDTHLSFDILPIPLVSLCISTLPLRAPLVIFRYYMHTDVDRLVAHGPANSCKGVTADLHTEAESHQVVAVRFEQVRSRWPFLLGKHFRLTIKATFSSYFPPSHLHAPTVHFTATFFHSLSIT